MPTLKTFIMRAFSHDAPPSLSAVRKVKLNPIGEITETYFYPHQSCQSSARLVSRQALVESSVSGLSAVLGLSRVPPARREGIRSPQLRGVCSHREVGSGGVKLLGGEGGLRSPCGGYT